MRKGLAVIFFLLVLQSPVFSYPDFWQSGDEKGLTETIINSMTDEELLGQVLMLGYYGTSPSPEILNWIIDKNIGGVKIFGWNAGDLIELARAVAVMQRHSQKTRHKIPLFIATDQEGGWVRHVKGETAVTPGNLALGASTLPSDSYQTGYYIGRELWDLGINMNFAPTVDVYYNPEAHVIGPRAFSDDPLLTSVLAVAYYKGMEEAGIICTAKHFPGHGRANEDSHGTLPMIPATLEELWEEDLLPYRFLIREGLPAIMTGHLGFPNILGDKTPSSLSAFFQEEILRNRLGFKGLIITDDLQMTGAHRQGDGLPSIAKRALEAGNNMIMLSPSADTQERVWQELLKEIKGNPQFREIIRSSVKRILQVKLSYLKGDKAVPLYPNSGIVPEKIPDAEGREFFFQHACRSVTLIKGEKIPLSEPGRILLVGQLRSFLQEGKRYYPQAEEFFFPYSPFYQPRASDISSLKNIVSRYDTIIFCLANPASLEVLKNLQEVKKNLVIFSVLTPIYLKEVPWVESALAVYGTGIESIQAGYAVLKGDYQPEGKLPINFTLR